MSTALTKPDLSNLQAPTGSASTVQSLMEYYRKDFERAAPKHLDVNRFMRIVASAVSRNPELLACTQISLLVASMTAAQLGLEVGVMGQAYLVAYYNRKGGRKEAQLIPGYRGLVQLARNSGQVSTVYANVVYKQDAFTYVDGLDRRLEHTPGDHDELDNDITHAYAVCKLKDGSFQLEVMRRKSIDKIRARSKTKNGGPWETDYAEMAKKTVVKRLSKMLPLSIEMDIAARLDDRAAMGGPQRIELTETDDGLRVDVPPDDVIGGEPPAAVAPTTGTFDLSQFRPGTEENRGHEDGLPPRAQAAEPKPPEPPQQQEQLEKDLQASIDRARQENPEAPCSVSDFLEIEKTATDWGVKMKDVYAHVTQTMSVPEYSALPRGRFAEVISWIKAKQRRNT